MLATLILIVTITIPGQSPSPPATLRFPQKSLEECRAIGVEFVGESDDVRRFSFSCEVPS